MSWATRLRSNAGNGWNLMKNFPRSFPKTTAFGVGGILGTTAVSSHYQNKMSGMREDQRLKNWLLFNDDGRQYARLDPAGRAFMARDPELQSYYGRVK